MTTPKDAPATIKLLLEHIQSQDQRIWQLRLANALLVWKKPKNKGGRPKSAPPIEEVLSKYDIAIMHLKEIKTNPSQVDAAEWIAESELAGEDENWLENKNKISGKQKLRSRTGTWENRISEALQSRKPKA